MTLGFAKKVRVKRKFGEGYVDAITMDSWCLLCLETVGADTSWPVLGNTLYMFTGQGSVPTPCWIP